MQTYGGRLFRTPSSWLTTDPKLGNWIAGLGLYPVNMLCVPRSWAASPWVMERTTQILSAMLAVSLRCSENTSPSILVLTVPRGPRYSRGLNGFGSHVSWAAEPPAGNMWMSLGAGAP